MNCKACELIKFFDEKIRQWIRHTEENERSGEAQNGATERLREFFTCPKCNKPANPEIGACVDHFEEV